MPLMMARGLLKNKDTWFIVGEYYKFDKEMTTRSTQPFEENYNYKHNDLLVVALDESGARKFEIPLSRSYTARNFDTDLYPAFGILNGKLAVVYNDQYGKYFPNASSYANYKLPIIYLLIFYNYLITTTSFKQITPHAAAVATQYIKPIWRGNKQLWIQNVRRVGYL